ERLPEYMIPSSIVPLESLPLTPSGKVDRKALPAPVTTEIERDELYAAPRDSLEMELVEIWEEMLGVRPIGVRDSFFEVGGHSLLALRLFARIAQRWGRELPLATLFRAPTVEQLAGILRDEDPPALSSCLVPI